MQYMRIDIGTVCFEKIRASWIFSDIMERHGIYDQYFTFELEDLTVEQAFLIHDSCSVCSGCRT